MRHSIESIRILKNNNMTCVQVTAIVIDETSKQHFLFQKKDVNVPKNARRPRSRRLY